MHRIQNVTRVHVYTCICINLYKKSCIKIFGFTGIIIALRSESNIVSVPFLKYVYYKYYIVPFVLTNLIHRHNYYHKHYHNKINYIHHHQILR